MTSRHALGARLYALAGSAPFAYLSVAAVQGKVLWNIWRYRDLSAGDTSNYFTYATWWSDHRLLAPLFSPLYTTYWGTLKWFIHDTYAVTIVHRVIIVFAVTLLVLALLRRLLTPGIAWLIAVWWAIQPLNYDTLNEVHLFSLLPVLIAGIVALRCSGTRMRAAVFGILFAGAVLQRNELIIAAAVWLLVCLFYEWRARRSTAGAPRPAGSWRSVPVAYGVATVLVLLLGLLSISRAAHPKSIGGWVDAAQYKEDLALCQHYAVGYQQRHRADALIAWWDCESFMERDFGSRTPSLINAVTSNPEAMGSHFRWNLTLFFPYALQLALFDRTSGSAFHDPDYIPVETEATWTLLASLAVAGLVAFGLALIWRRRRWWWENWIRARAWGWALLASVAAMGLWVAITTHPRPAYLFPLNLSIMCLIGTSAMGIADRWKSIGRARAALPVMAVLLFLLVPSHYTPAYSNPLFGSGRGAADMVSRLQPYDELLAGSQTVLLGPYSFEACKYLAPEDPCRSAVGLGVVPSPGTSPERWVDSHGVTAIYANEHVLESTRARRALDELQRHGWMKVAPSKPLSDGWLLLVRTPEDQPTSVSASAQND